MQRLFNITRSGNSAAHFQAQTNSLKVTLSEAATATASHHRYR